jgi:hypothetical protein
MDKLGTNDLSYLKHVKNVKSWANHAMLPQDGQTRKYGFLAKFLEDGQTRKYGFLYR